MKTVMEASDHKTLPRRCVMTRMVRGERREFVGLGATNKQSFERANTALINSINGEIQTLRGQA